MRRLEVHRDRAIPLPQPNVDTDQLVPARFLKTTEKAGLDRALLADWRFREDGSARPDSPFDHPPHGGGSILLAGENFGSGSSREHAVWALMAYGIRVVLAPRLADIFRHNALENGLLAVEIEVPFHDRAVRTVQQHPEEQIEVDLRQQHVRYGDSVTSFEISPLARHRLLLGIDSLDYLLARRKEYERWERIHPSPVDTHALEGFGRRP
ncbi:MAG: 3-isopropylmalate dehydratase small subunit [Acidobacteriota bacterium]